MHLAGFPQDNKRAKKIMKHFLYTSHEYLRRYAPLNFSNIALYYNGVKGFDRPDDVTVKAAAEWWKGAGVWGAMNDRPRPEIVPTYLYRYSPRRRHVIGEQLAWQSVLASRWAVVYSCSAALGLAASAICLGPRVFPAVTGILLALHFSAAPPPSLALKLLSARNFSARIKIMIFDITFPVLKYFLSFHCAAMMDFGLQL